jgi:hypothetical protein
VEEEEEEEEAVVAMVEADSSKNLDASSVMS